MIVKIKKMYGNFATIIITYIISLFHFAFHVFISLYCSFITLYCLIFVTLHTNSGKSETDLTNMHRGLCTTCYWNKILCLFPNLLIPYCRIIFLQWICFIQVRCASRNHFSSSSVATWMTSNKIFDTRYLIEFVFARISNIKRFNYKHV